MAGFCQPFFRFRTYQHYINCIVTKWVLTMEMKDGKALLSGILNNDVASVKRIVASYFEAAMNKGIDGASVAIMESIGPSKK